jgi:hypothetical protein
MSTHDRLGRYARVIVEHVDSLAKRQLFAEHLETLRWGGQLTNDEQSRLTATLLGAPGQ